MTQSNSQTFIVEDLISIITDKFLSTSFNRLEHLTEHLTGDKSNFTKAKEMILDQHPSLIPVMQEIDERWKKLERQSPIETMELQKNMLKVILERHNLSEKKFPVSGTEFLSGKQAFALGRENRNARPFLFQRED